MTLTVTDLSGTKLRQRLRVGSLFSGVGGLDLAAESFFDAETVWHVEFDAEPSKVLAAHWPGVPNYGDITTVDWSQVEPVDILCGGFPCQDLSLAGRRAGMRPGTRSGLWADFVAAIAALRPSVVVIENVRGLLSGCAESDSDVEPCPGCLGVSNQHRPLVRALGRVLGDLAALGFDAEWGALHASDVGAPHGRFRVFVVAYARGLRLDSWRIAGSGETSGGWASAEPRGRDRAPLTLLPMPSAASPNEGEDLDSWQERRERVKASGVNGNGFGVPLGVAVRLLPTPQAHDAVAGKTPEQVAAMRRRSGAGVSNLNEVVPALLPTPVTSDAKGARNPTAHRETRGAHSGTTITDVLLPTPQVADAMGGHAARSGDRSDELLLPGVAVAASRGDLLPTPRASRGASSTETMYALGAARDDEGDMQGNVTGPVSWGRYEPAVRRWEVLTRPAPHPTRPDGLNGRDRLNPELPEWMQGYPAGWITDHIKRDPAMKAAGNSVCPQQAFEAIRQLWTRIVAIDGIAA